MSTTEQAPVKNQKAIWFYFDHYYDPFLKFQTAYLGNPILKLGRLIFSNKPEHNPFAAFEEWVARYNVQQSREACVNENTIEKLRNYGIQVNDLMKKFSDKILDEYLHYIKGAVETFFEDAPVALRDNYLTEMLEKLDYGDTLEEGADAEEEREELVEDFEPFCGPEKKKIDEHVKSDNAKYYWPYTLEDGTEIMIFARYSGIWVIKGKIGDVPVIFAYGGSRKYEIPCCTHELFGGNHYSKNAKKLTKSWLVEGDVGFINCRFDHKEKEEEELQEPAAKKMKSYGGYRDIENFQDLKDYLGVQELPENVKDAFRKSYSDEKDPSCLVM